jgi:DNA-binding LacI/PurR family transcriptional regulator
MRTLATRKEIAKIAGVSERTVYRALNNMPEVSEATREKVQNIARRFGYQPNAIAQALVRRETRTLGIIVGDCSHPFYAPTIRAISETASEHDYTVFLCNTGYDDLNLFVKAVNDLTAKKVDGLLILPVPNTDGEIEILKARGIPVVLINRYVERHAFDCVYSDNQFGGYELTKHLIALGHRNIAYIDHCYTSSAARDRFSGFQKAMSEQGLREDLRFEADYRSQIAIYGVVQQILNQNDRATAIFAYNDLMAIYVMRALKEAGVRIPDEMALVGYDNIAMAELLDISLTSVDQSPYEVGVEATRLLLKQIKDPGPARQIAFKPQIIVRASS